MGIFRCSIYRIDLPITCFFISKISVETINWVTLIIGIYMIMDFCLTSIRIKNINIKLTKLSEITANIKEKLEELKNIPAKAKNIETLRKCY